MQLELEAKILGRPRPQGSLRVITSASTRRPVAVYSDSTTQHRNMVIAELAKEWAGRQPLTGPVAVKAHFIFRRPKSHFGSGGNADKLKGSAPSAHTNTPDTDKLLRLLGDALTIAGVIGDDSQISPIRGEKSWTDGADCTFIEVWSL